MDHCLFPDIGKSSRGRNIFFCFVMGKKMIKEVETVSAYYETKLECEKNRLLLLIMNPYWTKKE
jgi:hypothetical protein